MEGYFFYPHAFCCKKVGHIIEMNFLMYQKYQAIKQDNSKNDKIKSKENKEKIENLFKKLNNNKYKKGLYNTDCKCTICSENFTEENFIIKLVCNHIFHLNCFKFWLFIHIEDPKCPICFVKFSLKNFVEYNSRKIVNEYKDYSLDKNDNYNKIVCSELGFMLIN
jgi:hypothetical protein